MLRLTSIRLPIPCLSLAAWREASLAFCLAGCFLAGSAAAWADDVLPAAYPASRYEKFGGHSPFSPPTVAAVAPPPMVAPAGSWADKLSITLLMQEGNQYVATVLDRDSGQHFIVTSDKPNEQDLLLTSVQWADKFNLTRVTLRKGAESGQLSFDPNASGGASTPPIPGSAPPRLPSPAQTIFHPPPPSNTGTGGLSTIVRRPPISAVPAPVNPPHPFPGLAPVKPAADDDDDNDE